MKKLINLAFVVSMALIACSCGNSDEQQGESEEKTVTETQTETVVEEEKYFSYQLLESRNLYVRYNFMDSKCLTDDGCFFDGLIICYGDSKSSQYLLFDDEEEYYNESIYEWSLALKTASELYNKNKYHFTRENRVRIGEGEYCDYLIDRRRGDTLITYTEYTYQNYRSYAIDNHGDTIFKGDTIKGYDYVYFENPKKSIGQLLAYVHCMPNCIDNYTNSEIVEIFKKTYYDLQEAPIYEPEKGYGFRKYPIDEKKYGHDYVTLYRIKEGEYKNIPGGVLGIKFESESLW